MRTSSPVSSRDLAERPSPRSSRRASGVPLGRVQVHDVALAPATADDELGSPGLVADDDAARGRGGRGPQACHGAVAALDGGAIRSDRSGPSASRRGPRRGRSRTAGSCGRGPRQPAAEAGERTGLGPRGARSARRRRRRRTPAAPRPSRRSRARLDGRTKRAAGRAAYLAAMLCSMGRNGTASVRPCKRRRERFAHGGRGLRCQRATARRRGRSRGRAAAT